MFKAKKSMGVKDKLSKLGGDEVNGVVARGEGSDVEGVGEGKRKENGGEGRGGNIKVTGGEEVGGWSTLWPRTWGGGEGGRVLGGGGEWTKGGGGGGGRGDSGGETLITFRGGAFEDLLTCNTLTFNIISTHLLTYFLAQKRKVKQFYWVIWAFFKYDHWWFLCAYQVHMHQQT